MKNFKTTAITLDNENVTDQSNITGEITDIITYTVPKNRIVMPFDNRAFFLRLTGHEQFTGQDLSGSTATVSPSNFDLVESPDTKLEQMATGWTDESSYTKLPIDSLSYYNASNEITLDTSSVSGSPQEVEVYGQMRQGNVKVFVEKPSGGSVRRQALGQFEIGRLHERNWYKKEQAPTLARTMPVIQHGRIIISIKSPNSVTWDLDDGDHPNDVPVLKLPMAIGQISKVGTDVESQWRKFFGGG